MADFKLKWDQDGQRIYETGVDRGVVYPKGENVEGKGPYNKGYAWNGLSGVTESPSGGEATAIYADNGKYLNLRSAEEFGATVEAYTYPPEFGECDGTAKLSKGITIGQQPRKPFGFCYRTIVGNDTKNDEYGYKLHLVYGCDAAPSEKAYKTVNDTPEAISFSWEFSSTPVSVSGFKPTSVLTVDSTLEDPEKVAALEAILYGTGENEPRLPLPDEVATMFAEG